jgi:hypothetical protein
VDCRIKSGNDAWVAGSRFDDPRGYLPWLADPAEAEKFIAAASAFVPSLPDFDPAE